MRVSQLNTLEELRIKFARKLSINISENQTKKIEQLIEQLQDFSKEESPNGCPVEINYHTKEFNFPICFNFPAGHKKNNRPIILGKVSSLDINSKVNSGSNF